MEEIIPQFKDENEKSTITLIIALSVVCPLIVTAVAFFGLKKETFSPSSIAVIKALLNFDLLLLIISLVVSVVSAVPIIGWIISSIASALIYLVHVLVTLIPLLGIVNNQPVKVFSPIKFIQ